MKTHLSLHNDHHHHPAPSRFRTRLVRLLSGLSAVLHVGTATVDAAFEIDDPSSFLLPFAAPMSIRSNPAVLPGLECWRWQLGHQVPFGLRELSAHHFATAVSGRRWGAGGGFSLRGPERYRETAGWFGSGVSVTSSMTLGAAVHYLQISGVNVKTVGAAGVSAGLRLQLTATVEVDAWHRPAVGGLAQPRLNVRILRLLGGGGGGEGPESTAQVGWSRRGPLGTSGSTQPSRLDLAAKSRAHRRLWLFLGTRSDPRQLAIGGRVLAGRHFLDYRVLSHAALGATHAAMIGRSCESH